MKASDKFHKGQRVHTSPLALQEGVCVVPQYGTVRSFPRGRADADMVTIQRDGLSAYEQYSMAFWEPDVTSQRAEEIDKFLARHCTQSDDHNTENCRKCAQMRDELHILFARVSE